MSIRVRLTLWHVAVLCVGLALFAVSVLWQTDRAADEALNRTLANRAHDVAADLRVNRRIALRQDAPDEGTRQPGDATLWIRVLDAQGNVVVRQGPPLLNVPAHLLAKSQAGVFDANLNHGRHLRLLVLPVKRNGRRIVVQVLTTTAELEATRERLMAAMGVAGVVIVLLAALGGLILADRALRPVDRITRLAAGIGASDLHKRVGDALGGRGQRRSDELGRLVATFDGMLARLEESVTVRQRLTADVAHELGTPIATIASAAEIALRRPRSPEQYRAVLQQVVDESQHMGRLVDDLLLLARADAGQLPLAREIVEVDEVCRQVVRANKLLAQERGITLTTQLPHEALLVVGDEGRLGQVVRNLLDNALRYTPRGGTVTVTLQGMESKAATQGQAGATGYVVLRVRDTGPGIDPRERERVFERFHRDERGRLDGKRDGSGLGLAICRAIVLAHEGQIRVEDSRRDYANAPSQGAEIVVTLPRVVGDARLHS